MAFTIDFSKDVAPKGDTAVIGLFQDLKLTPAALRLDQSLGGIIAHQMQNNASFKGNEGQILTIALPAGAPYLRLVLLGLGQRDTANATRIENAGATLGGALNGLGSKGAAFLNGEELKAPKLKLTQIINHLGYGALLGSYRYDAYKSKPATVEFERLTFSVAQPKPMQAAFADDQIIGRAIHFARNLINDPPNILYPESFAERIRETLTPLGVKVSILDETEIRDAGMGCFSAVGMGSDNPPRLVVMEWGGAASKGLKRKDKSRKPADQPLAFVGKGITYDSGGYAIKPAESMADMKADMAGAAAVVGLMQVLASRKCKVPVVCAVALAENMISGKAYRNGDILKSLNGKTVEILNTDAEGRLVLCDTLTYVQNEYDPKFIINLATLTGAIVVALGSEYAGTFVNDNALWKGLEQASAATGEKLWRMPLDEVYRKDVEGAIADLKNIGSPGAAGSCSAAAFLEHFIDQGRPWAHLDIAGTGMVKKPRPTHPRLLGTGFGIRVLNQFVRDHHG